jgi:hypothetical protein
VTKRRTTINSPFLVGKTVATMRTAWCSRDFPASSVRL